MRKLVKSILLTIVVWSLVVGNVWGVSLQQILSAKESAVTSEKIVKETKSGSEEAKEIGTETQELKEVEKNQLGKSLEKTQLISPIEKDFAARLEAYRFRLKQFGYNFFKGKPAAVLPAVDKSTYVLGPGDELYLYVIGQIPGVDLSEIPKLVVDREGKIYIPGVGVFYVWGKTVAEAEKEISKALKTNIKLTVGRLRTFPVYVSGEVNRPGAVVVTALHTVIDALMMAGGVKKTGSLRHIIVTRKTAKGIKRIEIDLYDLLLKGEPVDLRLRDGDVIYVPPIGKVVGIAGGVKRPAIYEIKGNETLEDIIKMAGGVLASSYKYKVVIQRYSNNKVLKIEEGNLDDKSFILQKMKDGDLIVIQNITPIPQSYIVIKGEIKYPGVYAYKKGMKLSDILKPDMLLLNTNLHYAEIDRRDLKTLNIKKIIKFSPLDILEHKKDIELQPLDVIQFYPKYVFAPIKVSGCVNNAGYVPYYDGITLKDVLAEKEFCEDVKNLKVEVFREVKGKKSVSALKEAQNIAGKTETEKETVEKHIFSVYLYDLLIAKKPNTNISLFPGDEVVVKRIKKDEIVEKVTVSGYVKKPGVYPITEKTTLYDVLKAAGGFRKDAYPEGIVVIRKSVAEMQKQRLSRAIVQMQKQLEKEEAGILQSDLKGEELRARQAAIEAKRKLLELMQKTEVTGRITGLKIPRNLEALKNSSSNILLENGDQIIVPKKPSTVLVFGEVFNPSALVYEPGMTVEDYIKRAGGFTKNADISEIFVIKANGEAYRASGSTRFISWDRKRKRFILGAGMLSYVPKPGEAIIVPTKIKVPIMWRPLIKDVIQIIYQSALTVYTITHL